MPLNASLLRGVGDGVQISLLHFTSCVTLDELFGGSVPWFPHLCNGDENDIDLIRLPGGLDIQHPQNDLVVAVYWHLPSGENKTKLCVETGCVCWCGSHHEPLGTRPQKVRF